MMSEKKNKRNEDMMSMRKNGITYKEIGYKFGISRERVYQILGKSDIDACSKRNEHRNKKIRQLRMLGHNINEISNKIGMSIGSINRLSSCPPPYIRVWWNINIDNCNECWSWTGAWMGSDKHRYGHMTINKKGVLVHRFFWEWKNNRDVPKGKYVLHKCNNTRCVNPDHLYVGSAQDNANDRKNTSNGILYNLT